MKRILTSAIFVLLVLSSCSNGETEVNKETVNHYYLALSGESEHWKLGGYEIMMTPDGYKAGNGILEMKDEEKQRTGFLSYDVYAVVDGEENRIHGGSVSGDVDITEERTGTIDGEEESLKAFPELDEIYMNVTWNNDKALFQIYFIKQGLAPAGIT